MKAKKPLQFVDLGAHNGGGFLCQGCLDGQEVTTQSASSKKEAKRLTAVAMLEQLQLI